MRPNNLLLLSSFFAFACSGDISIAPIEKGNGTTDESSINDAEGNGEFELNEVETEHADQSDAEGSAPEEETEEEEIIEEEWEEEDTDVEEEIADEEETTDIADFETEWYVYDDGQIYDTTSNPNYHVDQHGASELYWYEQSGVNGLLESSDPQADFEIMRTFVIDRAGEPEATTEDGNFTYFAESTLNPFNHATFTYFLCDFFPEEGVSSSYFITAESVDDGVQVIFNGEILGYHTYGEGRFFYHLPNVQPGERNTIIITLADDSKYEKGIKNLKFLQSGFH